MTSALVCDAVRTPFGRYGGGLARVRADDLAALPIRALMERNPGMPASAIDEVILGCANQAGEDNRNVARMALLLAGLPETVPGMTVNRLCGSGLEAVSLAARAIRSGEAGLVIAGGVESMSRAPFVMAKADAAYGRGMKLEDTTLGWRFINPRLQEVYGTESMAETAENVAAEFGISRLDQDAFALRSHERALVAIDAGRLAEEIMPVEVAQDRGDPTVIDRDEQPRRDTSATALARLKGVVRTEGTVTAGNASGINDGACAVLLASEAAAQLYGLTPLAAVRASAVAGVAPRIMGIGPLPATRKLLDRMELKVDSLDVIEVNEAFAAQALAVLRGLGLPDDAAQVNPNGGAIALGHPLGASGARLVTTATYELRRSGGRFGLCTMCIGVGQGISLLLERV